MPILTHCSGNAVESRTSLSLHVMAFSCFPTLTYNGATFIIDSSSSTEKRGNSKEHWTGELLIGPADQLSTNISMHDVVTYMYVNLLVVQYPLFTF